MAAAEFSSKGVPQDDTDPGAINLVKIQLCILNCFAGRVQRQPVRDIGGFNRNWGNSKLQRIERPICDDSHAVAVGLVRSLGVRIEIF